jgi:tetratricopeptide (TPR) repeat protein
VLLHETPPRIAEAIPLLRRAIQLDSTQLVSIRSLAAVEVARGELKDAKSLLEREVAIGPGYADGAVRLGMVLVALGEPEQAARYLSHPDLDRLADDDPSGQSLAALGTTFSTLGRWSDAVTAYRRALVLTRHVPAVEELLGDALLRDNRVAEAIPTLEDAVQRRPNSSFGLALLSLAYASAGRFDAALPLTVTLLQVGADDPFIYGLAGQAMMVAHRPAEAATLFQRALALDPNYLPARRALTAIDSAGKNRFR